MAEVRVGDEATALAALPQARAAFAERADALGLALCDEVQAIYLRRVGDYAGSAALQADIDRRDDFERDAMYRFVAHNSRAITHKVLGHQDEALRHFYAAHEAAQQTDLQGPLITALSNLAGYHQNLFNHEDGRAMGEQALRMAREVGARQIVGNSAINLITAYHALGEPTQARAMAEFILTHPEELLPGSLQRYALPLALGHLAVGEIDAALQHLKAGAIAGVSDGDGMSFWAWLKARCLLAQGQPAQARAVAEQTLLERRQQDLHDHPYDAMQLHRALADACEAAGDAPAALAYLRQGQAIYEQLVGRSARARYMAQDLWLFAGRVSTVGKAHRQRVREVAAVVQAAAFVAAQRRAHDQLRADHQVAQFQQVAVDAEVGVVVVDLAAQQLDAVQRPLQPLGGAHDADVVPHQQAQFVPVVGDDDLLVGVLDLALVPGRQARRRVRGGAGWRRRSCSPAPHIPAANCWPAGWRRAGRCRWSRPPRTGPADRCGRPDRSPRRRRCSAPPAPPEWAARDVDAQRRQRAWMVGKCDFRNSSPRWRGVQPDMVQAVLLHLEVDRTGDDVARRQFSPLVVVGHEARAVRQGQVPAFATQRLGDQEAALLRVVQAGRVELDELHVADAAAARQAIAMPSPVAVSGLLV
jgi:tetratricopeptide (TPR) repeat protein